MMNHSYEEAAASLQKEVERQKQKIIDLEHRLGEKDACMSKLVESLNTVTKTFNKDKCLHEECQKEDDEDAEVLKKVDALEQDLREKEQSLEDLDEMIQILTIKERKYHDELQAARKQLINGIQDISTRGRGYIGVKRMGELDEKPFLQAMIKRYNEEEAEERASKLCSLWEEYLKDPNWYPFKVITIEGKVMEIIKDDDEKLNELKNDLGEGAYKAVVVALTEMNEYDPSGRKITLELWNYGQGRRATVQEGVQFLLNQWKVHKRKRGMM